MAPDVFLTGGSGLVGGHLLSELVAKGRHVTALARTQTAADRVESLGGKPFVCDILDHASLARGMAGTDTVFHVAGVNEVCSADPEAMDRTNIEGSRSVVAAAARASVRRVVHTSSVSVIGELSGSVGTEETVHDGSFLSRYARSKFLGERAAFAEGVTRGVEVVAINPASVQGPGRAGGSARILLHALRSRRPVLVDVVFSVIDIADCTEGHLLAAANGKPGERYILSGGSMTSREAVRLAEEIVRRPINAVWIPPWLMTTMGAPVAALVSRVRPDAGICPEFVRTLAHGHRFDGSKAADELGLVYTPVGTTFKRTIDWFENESLVPRS